ncbi:hypothetical protein ABZT48_39235, partial [Streptomyces avermitilis]|uniref:hypothetical protein n=1 Tax=Streptomyces avermitilis TaxID=33903 RepID=UPI0033B07F98
MDVPTWGNGGLMTQMTQVCRTVQAGMPGTAWLSVIWRWAAIAWQLHTTYQPPLSLRSVVLCHWILTVCHRTLTDASLCHRSLITAGQRLSA